MKHLAKKIGMVRERLGFSQREVAARLGVSASLVSKWEQGEREPDAAQVWELSRLFGVTADYLISARTAVDFCGRSVSARNRKQRECLAAALNDAAQQVEFVHEVWELTETTPQRLALGLEFSGRMLPKLAQVVRDYLRLNERVTYGELREALRERDVLVFEWKLPPKLSGLSYQGDLSVVFVNDAMPERVKLFTLCHELAHLLFHLRGGHRTEVSGLATRNDPGERQANEFAAELLMPHDSIQLLVERHGSRLLQRAVFWDAVERFGVSPGALFYRLSRPPWNLMDYAMRKNLFSEGERPELEDPGARVDDPARQVAPAFLGLVCDLWRKGAVTSGKVAELCFAARSKMDIYLAALKYHDEESDDANRARSGFWDIAA